MSTNGQGGEPWVVEGGTIYTQISDVHGIDLYLDDLEQEFFIDGDDFLRRIVACVNACDGIPTEDLEAGGLADLARGFLAKGSSIADDPVPAGAIPRIVRILRGLLAPTAPSSKPSPPPLDKDPHPAGTPTSPINGRGEETEAEG